MLFTNDSDFVPAVWALRRSGKRVFCACSPTQEDSGPLVQACQHFFPWNIEFLKADVQFFTMLQPGGAFDQALQHRLLVPRKPKVKFDGATITLIPEGGLDGNGQNAVNGFVRPYGWNGDLDGGHKLVLKHLLPIRR